MLPRSIKLQMAADSVGAIAEAVDAIGKMLDKFHAEHGEELYGQIERAWPDAVRFGGTASKPLYQLELNWTAPEA